MALQKRLHYGFSGYQVPPTPRGLRSARGNHSLKRKLEETQMGAFELLATVAGKLLQERETSPAFSNVSSARAEAVVVKNNVKQEEEDIEQPMNAEICDQGSIHENVVSKFGFQGHNQKSTSEEFQHAANGIKKNGNLVNGAVPNTCNSDDPLELDSDPPALVNSDSSEEVPFPGCQDDAKLVSSRDDDENSSGCTEPSITPLKASRPSKHIEDREIRKLLTSKYWEVAPKLEGEIYNNDEDKKPVPHVRNTCYTRQRSMRDSFKRRKIDKSSVSTSDGGVSSEGTSNTTKKGTDTSTIGCSSEHAGSGVSSSLVGGQETSCQSKDSHVKLSIKSFKVPELYIEIPETATVASLKRTVLEAVAAILGEGLHVGVLYQGKHIRDDSKTLLQSGICDDDKLDDWGFALEPNPLSAPASGCPKHPPYLEVSHPLTRCPPSPTLGLGVSDASPDSPIIGTANDVESDDSVPSPTEMLIEKKIPESRDLVAVPAISVEALAVVPLNRKSRRAELAQRRIRRPFSVTEVEALVHAVEKLGTGRWRDVKMRAFENAKHRTYVDLKDKWKTLVHTAKISPQQRRGEPVPQELLNRVLAAHSHWSEQQAKQQVKQLTETCLLLQT